MSSYNIVFLVLFTTESSRTEELLKGRKDLKGQREDLCKFKLKKSELINKLYLNIYKTNIIIYL